MDESLDDVVLSAGLAGLKEDATLQVTATMPFCCDAYVRVFEVQFTTTSPAAGATCRWYFDDGRFSGNRITSHTLDKLQTREAIAIAKDAGVELILIRYLWQTQPSAATELGILLDTDYCAREIERIRQEAERIGAALVGFDTETYGRTQLHDYFRASDFLEEDYDVLVETIDAVVEQVGQVDFVLPAGAARHNHPYTALSGLGKQRISEGTYYDNEENIAAIKYPYELSGMYMNVIKKNERLPWKPYFLPGEVFGDKAYIWRRKEGLMI